MITTKTNIKYRLKWSLSTRVTIYSVVVICFTSCNVTKHLADDEKLINQHRISLLDDEDDIENAKELKYALKNIARPRVNRKFLGIYRRKLSAYYRTRENKEYGWYKKWLKNNVAEPPALFDSADVDLNITRMLNYLHDQGYWKSDVTYHVKDKKHSVNITYNIKLNKPYRIKETNIYSKDHKIDSLIRHSSDEQVLVPGAKVSLENYNDEVDRISKLLRNEGYAAFLPSTYIDELRGDTLGHYRLEVFLVNDSLQHETYNIGNIDVYMDHPGNSGKYLHIDTINGVRYHYTHEKPYVKTKLLDKKVEFKPGSIYRKKDIDQTRVLLGDVIIFNRTSITTNVRDTANIIDYAIRLARKLRYAWNTDISAGYTQVADDNRIGLSGSVGFTDRNMLRGGEVFTTQLRGGIEFDLFSEGANGIISTDLQFNNSLRIPDFKDIYRTFWLLNKLNWINSGFYKQVKRKAYSTVGANAQYLTFKGFYSYQNYEVDLTHSVDYKNKKYNITQTGINFWKPKTEPLFRMLNRENPNLLASFQPRILTGLIFRRFDMNYLSKVSRSNNQLQFLGSFEASGHELFLGNLIYRGIAGSNDIFNIDGINFAQFIKLDLDGRFKKYLDLNSSITARATFGIAVPYGFNRGTNVVPYVSQFGVGGPYSIRGWEAREIGPGASLPVNASAQNVSFAQKGDIKLELNMEYRTRLFWYLHGAAFVDAGNVWVIKKEGTPSNEVFGTHFIDQIAVGAGYGFRFDYNSQFVIRLDLGYKLRQPYVDEGGENWIVHKLKIKNANFNFAVGYPF